MRGEVTKMRMERTEIYTKFAEVEERALEKRVPCQCGGGRCDDRARA